MDNEERINRVVNKIEEFFRELDPYDTPPIEETIGWTTEMVTKNPLQILEQVLDAAIETLG